MPGGRLARPGRPPRHSGPNPGALLILVVIVAAVAVAAFFFSRPDPARIAPQPQAARAAGVGAEATATTPAPTPTATLPVISSGSVPGVRPAGAAESPAPDAATDVPAPTLAPATQTAATAAPSTAPAAVGSGPTETPPGPAPGTDGADLAALAQRMLELVNADREANGLQPVAWDATAAAAGQKHSEEMAQFGYMSHWNMDGYGPEYRYSRAGGLDMSQENVYRLVHQWEDGRGAPIDDWEQVVADAQAALMNSPGHRANILAPEHTHLGVGIAYNAATGNVAIAQEFVNRYVTIEPLPQRAQPGDRLVLRGTSAARQHEPARQPRV